jgi:hypothetical protein
VRNGPLAIIFTGFMIHMAMEMWSFKPKLDFKPHLLRLVLYGVLVMSYGTFAQTISGFVMSFGAINATSTLAKKEKATSFLVGQKAKFDAAKLATEKQIKDADALSASKGVPAEKKDFTDQLVDGFGTAIGDSFTFLMYLIMRLITEASFLFASLAIFFLKMLQSTMMSVIIGIGPIMIAFGSWPGVTSRYLSSWLSALIETAAWGFVAKVFIALLVTNATRQKDGIEDANFFEYMGLNILYAASLLSVPAITSSILRGSAATGVTASGMLAATTGVATGVASSLARGAASASSAAQRAFEKKREKPPEKPPEKRPADDAADTAYTPPP